MIASLVVPAKAVNNVLYVWDYLTDHYEENGVLNYSFSFQDIPSYYTIVRDDTAFVEGYPPLSITSTPANRLVQVHAWPLGVRNWPTAACSGGVIAVSDFERFISVDLTCTGTLFFLYNGTTSGASYEFQVKSYWQMLYYDASGNYLGNDVSVREEHSITFYAPVNEVPVQAMGVSMNLEMPEGTAYFCPLLKTELFLPDQGSDFVYKVYTSFDGFTLGCSASSVMQNTETLMRIEEQLGDLNDKTDTIINGTPEISDKVENMEDDVTNQKDDMWVVEDAEKEYLDQWEDSNNEFKNKILTFLQGVGWVQLADLLSPFMNWSSWTTVMIMVVAFVNLSVILFGR